MEGRGGEREGEIDEKREWGEGIWRCKGEKGRRGRQREQGKVVGRGMVPLRSHITHRLFHQLHHTYPSPPVTVSLVFLMPPAILLCPLWYRQVPSLPLPVAYERQVQPI